MFIRPAFVFVNALLETGEPTESRKKIHTARRLPTRAGATGSVLLRAGWKPNQSCSGFAVVWPPSPDLPEDRIVIATDDSTPPPGPNDTAPPSTTLPLVHKKASALQGLFELFRPNALLGEACADWSIVSSEQIFVVRAKGAELPVKIAGMNFEDQMVHLKPAVGDHEPEKIKLALFLRSIVIGATGALDWDGITPRAMQQPPMGIQFGPPPAPPPGPAPPGPEEPTVDISPTSPLGDMEMVRLLMAGLPFFGAGVDWTRARFIEIAARMSDFTSRGSMRLSYPKTTALSGQTQKRS